MSFVNNFFKIYYSKKIYFKNNEKITPQEFDFALQVLQKFIWADQGDRSRLQELGLNLVPVNYYSNTPVISEILNSYEYKELVPPYLNCGIFDQKKLRVQLLELIPYSSGFTAAEEGNEETCTKFFWKNSQFSYSDAMAYYAFIKKINPKQYSR